MIMQRLSKKQSQNVRTIPSVRLLKTALEMGKHQSAFVESTRERDPDLVHTFCVEVIINYKSNVQ